MKETKRAIQKCKYYYIYKIVKFCDLLTDLQEIGNNLDLLHVFDANGFILVAVL